MDESLTKTETIFEEAKASRLAAKHRWEAAQGRLHVELVARREAGEKLTVADMRAIKAVAIDDVDYVKDAYLAFIAADSAYRAARVAYDAATRLYWEGRGR